MELDLVPPSFKENGVSNPVHLVRIFHDEVEVLRFIERQTGRDETE